MVSNDNDNDRNPNDVTVLVIIIIIAAIIVVVVVRRDWWCGGSGGDANVFRHNQIHTHTHTHKEREIEAFRLTVSFGAIFCVVCLAPHISAIQTSIAATQSNLREREKKDLSVPALPGFTTNSRSLVKNTVGKFFRRLLRR